MSWPKCPQTETAQTEMAQTEMAQTETAPTDSARPKRPDRIGQTEKSCSGSNSKSPFIQENAMPVLKRHNLASHFMLHVSFSPKVSNAFTMLVTVWWEHKTFLI